jgi:multiple sugar transport system permease protein
LFFTEAKTGMVDTVWGMIAPSAVSPVAVYLMRVFASNSVPLELMDAARIDGAGELRIFGRIAMPLMVPGMATVLVLNTVSVWNSYLLPLVVFSKANLYPLTVGLGTWAENGGSSANRLTVSPILIGSILAIVPLLIVFIVVQKYWRGGALSGAMAGN